MKIKLITFTLVFAYLSSFSQNVEESNYASTEVKENKTLAGKVWNFLWGDPTESAFTAMPIGLHTDFEKHSSKTRSTINGLHEAMYFSANVKNIELAGFQNSFGDLVVAVFYKRTWNFTKRFSVNVGAGLMHGYDGRLQNTSGIPFRRTFLIKGDINPVTGFELDYKVYKKWSIHTSIAPRIIVYGFRYRIE